LILPAPKLVISVSGMIVIFFWKGKNICGGWIFFCHWF